MSKLSRFFLSLLFLSALLAGWPGRASASRLPAGSASEVIDLVNSLRAGQGLPSLAVNAALMAAAQGHSDYQASSGTVTHTGAGGTRPGDRAAGAGYGGSVAENIFGGGDASAQQVVNWWTGDAPHWTTMMNASATDVGAGVASANGSAYYTLLVGSNGGRPAAQVTVLASQTAPAAVGTAAPTQELVSPVVTVTPQPDGSVVHQVQFGQTPITIAQAYGITLAQLLAQNGLGADATIFVGDLLIIQPGPTPTLTATITETGEPTERPTRTPRPRTPTATPGAAATDAPPTVAAEPTAATPSGLKIDRRTAGIAIVAVSALGLLLVGLTAFRRKG